MDALNSLKISVGPFHICCKKTRILGYNLIKQLVGLTQYQLVSWSDNADNCSRWPLQIRQLFQILLTVHLMHLRPFLNPRLRLSSV